MKIAQEEIFGPVLSVITADNDKEARWPWLTTVATAWRLPSTPTTSIRHPRGSLAAGGAVLVDCYSEGDMGTPFGGFKTSGFFGRDNSIFAHYQYTELKTIWFRLATNS